MSSNLEKLRRQRGIVKGGITKLITKIEKELKETVLNGDILEECFNQLNAKEITLLDISRQIENCIENLDELDKEATQNQELAENVITWKTRITQALRKIQDKQNSGAQTTNQKPTINLPRLILEKFNGKVTEWNSFWSQYDIAFHSNKLLSNSEKFAYLKTYLEGAAAKAISGLTLSDANYNAAIVILKDRFGRKDVVINSHMQNLLKLNPVRKTSDLEALRSLYDICENQIKSLESLGVVMESYGNLLCPILMQLLPEDINLEFIRQKSSSDAWDIKELLEFFQRELESRERAALVVRFHEGISEGGNIQGKGQL